MWSQLQSVIAAFFGVQSNAKREHDFKHHNPKVLIAIAIVLFIAFILGVLGLVQLVLPAR
ncbi:MULTISPECIES: DUF2970 domain-containing protein [Pseudoalteromonas]|uniref:DUF2970 domain-containing protein n=1 Tax=Pseudoalteromonas TaxID=53246 RepID=UPI00034D9380|nr:MULTISPECIES: DUF2970 domain-containing protein [Pseudoalteromonas]MCF2862626.1 DUF2970 domain-containing protein [Pseudoalteromonas sp. CNAT2-18]MCG7543213.1 DUF2970 domain-containing protein [Pseudoalteromonas sp. MM17-2]MCG7558922.1 DUF2970 domain-containing protein [Pseudoalteromonas sp. CNAT2-18.1]MCG7567380.1 DUF2970 domain-containing protein [Pseudoalteromonas sp. CnMc7-15]MCG7570451.1 DUF2970 domain-containing protein [Pseudoalteromonas sp. CNC9-20]